MNKAEKYLKSLTAYLYKLKDSGTLEQSQREDLIRAIDNLRHSLKTRDRRSLKKEIANICQIFLK